MAIALVFRLCYLLLYIEMQDKWLKFWAALFGFALFGFFFFFKVLTRQAGTIHTPKTRTGMTQGLVWKLKF